MLGLSWLKGKVSLDKAPGTLGPLEVGTSVGSALFTEHVTSALGSEASPICRLFVSAQC